MKILIGGDSWGCGEWGYYDGDHITGKYGILHSGLEYYLRADNHTVINTSLGRSSNRESIVRLKTHLDCDAIFWFQSDPLRDCKINCKTFDEVIELNISSLLQNYNELNSLNKTIHVIGGCGKINTAMISKFTNLIPLIESVPQFLYPDFVHPDIWISDFVWDDLYNTVDNNMLSQLLERKKIVDSMHDGKYYKYFQPDGRHPNRLGHQKIYEFIKIRLEKL
jgi:hypothetical protein